MYPWLVVIVLVFQAPTVFSLRACSGGMGSVIVRIDRPSHAECLRLDQRCVLTSVASFTMSRAQSEFVMSFSYAPGIHGFTLDLSRSVGD